MSFYDQARYNMAYNQIRPHDIADKQLLEIFKKVPREKFVPKEWADLAYTDENVPLLPNRVLLAPATLARMIQGAHIEPEDGVLDIACGMGYSTVILSQLAKVVISVESDNEFFSHACFVLTSQNIKNAHIVLGPLSKGYPSNAPYDVIFINGCVEEIPKNILNQLKIGGRLITILKDLKTLSYYATIFYKTENGISKKILFETHAPVLEEFKIEKAFHF